MAEKRARVEDLLTCSVCLETFKDPVSLSCNHSFCSKCLHSFWEKNRGRKCLMCRRKSSPDFPPLNFALKQLAEALTDGQQLESYATALKDKKKKYEEAGLKFKQVIQHLQDQASSTEKQTRAEFDKLRLFLREEEESRLPALREEKEQKRKTVSRELEKVQEKMSSLSSAIAAVEEELRQKNTVVFLLFLQGRARDQCSQSEPQLVPGALIDVAKHLGNLSFTVWHKITDQVHFSPVILDPNTAACGLHLSDDLTRVRNGATSQQLPGNPERHTSVLGSEGFSSGQHSWEVEVGHYPRWNIGVAQESADRKGERCDSPKDGLWCLFYQNGKYNNGCSETVKVKKRLQSLRVLLDFKEGDVSFYDAVDTTHICTYKDTFTEKLFAFFSVGDAAGNKTAAIRMRERFFSDVCEAVS